MKITVLSGKGGTGKTTVAASMAYLSRGSIKVDCDVDAPNLNIILEGKDIERNIFIGSKTARIDTDKCLRCGECEKVCRYDAISSYAVDKFKCEGCAACTVVCRQGAVTITDDMTAETFITDTEAGMLSRAEMVIGAEGSGKLVTEVRKNADRYMDADSTAILDGSPGIGCAVMASAAGCDIALLVVEPTITGIDDFLRVLSLCDFFGVKTYVCINKYDINMQKSKEIEEFCIKNGTHLIGMVPYDETVKVSIRERKPVILYENSPAADEIKALWGRLMKDCKEELL